MKNKQLIGVIKSILIITGCCLLISMNIACHIYKVEKSAPLAVDSIRLKVQYYHEINKYIILNDGNNAYHILIDSIDAANNIIYCFYDSVDNKHLKGIPSGNNEKRYKPKKGESVILDEVHIIASGITTDASRIIIPIKAITSIEVVKQNKGLTVASYLTPILLIISTFVIIGVVAVSNIGI